MNVINWKVEDFDVPINVDDLLVHMGYAAVVMHILWFLEDRSNPKKASNLFTLVASAVCGSMSTIFVLTTDPFYSTVAHSWFAVGMILDFMYGYIWYPEYMYFATTTVHHSAYLFMEYKLWRAGILAPFSVYFPQEIPTFLLQAKRYWDIRDNTYETIFGISFMLLRIVYYSLVSYMLRDEITSDYFFVFAFVAVMYMHFSWFLDWTRKYFQRLSGKTATKKE